MSRPGGYSEEIDLHSEIQGICERIKPNVEQKAHEKYDVFIALRFIKQVVDGPNYIIKVYVGYAGADECMHVKVFQGLPCDGGKLEFLGYQYPKTKADIITPF